MNHTHRKTTGFSMIELVIVVVIIGIIAAIAIPRLSRGSEGAADSALKGDLAVLRNAIDLFAAEHNGTLPGDDMVNQLTQYTNLSGEAQATKDSTHIYGPYLRSIPPLPVGTKKTKTGVEIVSGAAMTPPGSDADAGWWYNKTTGDIRANLPDTDTDTASTQYNEY